MKTFVFIFGLLLFLSSCSDKDKLNEESVVEDATLYYYYDSGFGTSQCSFVIETNNNIFIPNTSFDLSEFMSNDSSNIKNNVKITYRLTDDKIDRCYHKNEFIENPIDVIEIMSLEKI